jgi:hypothetical protein
MFNWLSNPANLFWMTIAAIVIVPLVLNYMRQNKQHERETELKRDMIARGMSAEEIERVLAARSKHES